MCARFDCHIFNPHDRVRYYAKADGFGLLRSRPMHEDDRRKLYASVRFESGRKASVRWRCGVRLLRRSGREIVRRPDTRRARCARPGSPVVVLPVPVLKPPPQLRLQQLASRGMRQLLHKANFFPTPNAWLAKPADLRNRQLPVAELR